MKNNFGLYRSGCPFFGKSWFAYFFSPNWYSSLAYCLFSMNFHYFQLISVTFFAFLKSQSHTSKYWWITAECAKSAVEFIQTYWSDENKIQNIREFVACFKLIIENNTLFIAVIDVFAHIVHMYNVPSYTLN